MSHKINVITAYEEVNFVSDAGFTMHCKVNEEKTGVNVAYYDKDGNKIELEGDDDGNVVGGTPFDEETEDFFGKCTITTMLAGSLPEESFEVEVDEA